ncbi:hypothetical protein [Bacillus sp. AFS094611]|nr:hypothetical protein [Bacillus sp. AFS094611]
MRSALKIVTNAAASKVITKINIAFQEVQHHHSTDTKPSITY